MKKQKRAIKQKLLVSETCKLELKGMCESGESWAEVPELFCQVLEEDDSVKQCALLKKAAGILLQFTDHNKQGIPHEDYRIFLAFLAEVFVASNVKNPSRRIVASIFNSSPRVKYSFDVLCSVVFKKLSSTMEMMEVGKEVFARSDIDMIVDILELFTLGTDVLRCNGHFVVAFLGMCLNKQWKAARAELTPTLQTTCMLDCLATIKTTISYLQKLRAEDSLPHVFDQLTFSSFKNQTVADQKACNNVAGSKAVKPLTDLLMDLLLDLSLLMCDELFFMDCRSTAGMAILVVLNILCSAENFVTTVGQLIFPSHVPHGEIRFSILGNLKKMPAFQCSQDVVSFSHLCLCNGVLTMVSPQVLIQSTEIIVNGKLTNGTLMFDALFPDLCCLCDGLKDSSSCLFAFRTLTLWASQARQIASTGRYDSCWLKDKLNGTSPIPTKLLSYVWSHWDHPIEGVRYQTKVICEHVVNLHLIVSQNDSRKEAFLKDLTESLLKVGWHVRGKYAALCCIASVVGAKKILLWFPTVPQEMYPLMRDRCLVPHVMDLVEKMANCHKQELKDAGEDVEAWEKTWMAPLLYHVHHGCKLMREHLAQYCLPKLLKCCPKSLQYLIKNLQGSNVPNSRDLGTLITCLKTARSAGLMSLNKNTLSTGENVCMWCGVVPVELMKKALCHLDDQIRLAAFGLLCDSTKTTESVTEVDLQLLQLFWPLNMNNQSPSFRQQAGAHFKKLLLRLKECLRISIKNLKQDKRNTDIPFYQHQLTLYREFLRWFCSSQFDSLFPGASITRRTTALCNLMLMKQVFGFDSNSAAIPDVDRFNCSEAITTDNVFILLDCLSDSYDVNKTMAYDIMLALPSEQLPFQEEASCLHWLNMIERLVSSPRAVDSSSAAMFLRLFVERCRLPLTFQKPNGAIPSNDDQESEPLCNSFKLDHVPCTQSFRVLSHLVDLLQAHSSTASRNLSLIGIQAPMHGVLYCLRSIISHTSLSSVADDEHWQNLMSILVTECLCTADIVAPVITSDSPEGCMADDIQGAEEDMLEIPDTLDDVIKAPASQLLLVCCWRTMKEVALLLGELSENAPLQVGNSKHGLLTAKQLHNIGAFFTKVLLNSKHRGAFELAYTGFAKLCAVMWRSVDKDFRQLPEKWLHSLLDDLTSDNPSEQLCGTRRSAGVPFFIQAIVTTEPPAAGRACFKQVMKKLLEIASQPIQETRIRDSTLPQVHACNILRALYRETKLGEDVFPFVSDGVVVAITGFHSNSWAMRNSSTLLFSALVTRVFGVKRTKDEHSKSNCMTGREFFSRFPELHSFLLSQLQAACQEIDRENTTPDPSLYPVLVILCRLYPSTMDGVDSALNIAAFVPFVISCRKSMVMKTRMMSARAVVPLVTGDSLIQTLQKLLQSLPVSSSNEVRQNEIHGTLLHIYHLLNGHVRDTTMSSTVIKQIVTEVILLLSQSAWIGTRSNPCALSRSVFLNIVLNFVVDQSWLGHTDNSELIVLAERNLQSLKQSFERMAIEETTNGQYCPALIGEVFARKALAEICLKVCEEFPPVDATCLTPPDEAEKTTSCSDVILTLLRSSEYEVRMAVLEFIIIHFASDTNIGRDYEVDLRQSTEDSRTDSWVFGKLDSRVKSELFTMAMEVEHHTECLVKVFQALYLLSDALSFPWILSSGNQISAFQCWTFVADLVSAPSQRDSLKAASLSFLSRVAFVMYGIINSNGQDTATATQAMEALSDFSRITLKTSLPSESEELRLCTAQVLGSTHVTDLMVDRQGTLGDVPFVLWSVLVKLLYDDEPVVRERMALGFASLLNRIQSSWLVAGLSLEGCAMVAPLSLESAFLCVWSIFIDRSPLACVSWMLEWIRGDLSRQTYDQTDELSDVDRLFEKGPLNLYAEDCIVTRAACKTIKQGIEMNNVLAVLTNKEHKTGLIELLAKELERCICFLESVLLTKLISNRNCFSLFYRTMAGLAVTVMLTQKVNRDMSSFESRISAIIRTLKMPSDTGGLSRHSMIIECMKELDALMFL